MRTRPHPNVGLIFRFACRIDLDDENSKPDADDEDGDGTATKDSDSKTTETKDGEFDRPSSSGKYQHTWIAPNRLY